MILKASVTHALWLHRHLRPGSLPGTAVKFDDIHRTHRKSGTVNHAPDITIQRP